MSFELGRATVEKDVARVRMISSAFRKTGRPVALVPLGAGVHAGHIALVRAAKAHRGAIVVVALHTVTPEDQELLAAEGVDVVYHYGAAEGGTHAADGGGGAAEGRVTRTLVVPPDHGLSSVDDRAEELTRVLALIGAVTPTDVLMGEKDYELLLDTNAAVHDLNLAVRIQGVPTVRMPDGVPVSLRNACVAPADRGAAEALSAALTAGAHAAESGAAAVIEVARSVLDAAGVVPDYLEVRGRDLGPAPEQGDARLLVAATIGGVRLMDNVGLPLGIGFRNLEEYQSQQEAARHAARGEN
ncbi:pantoate--beta-alanine ligase [uncultured Corynebacterium sp.]|uniref:pantoate--beta-alanine ligase n=1 Tax=uncultured Corynebacterium sp. TaxID=159447 RepID=UPI0025F98C11|nr:pantoate--beta-alanine ligase [uncultured Corynebacterium sp.]